MSNSIDIAHNCKAANLSDVIDDGLIRQTTLVHATRYDWAEKVFFRVTSGSMELSFNLTEEAAQELAQGLTTIIAMPFAPAPEADE